MLNVGLIGAGMMGGVHAGSIRKSVVARLAKVFAVDGNVGEFARNHGAQLAASADDILGDPSIDAVIIATPTDSHAAFLRQAHAAGKHVFCEKPVVRTEEEAAGIEALFDGYTKQVAVGHVVRFMPEYLHLKEVVASESLGNIGTIRFHRCCGLPATKDHWLTEFHRSGGAVLDLMIHDLDFLTWCFGDVDRLYAQRSDNRGSLRNDYALVVARMKSGAIAHLEGSWAEAPGTFYTGFEIAGSRGILDYDTRNEPSLVIKSRISSESGAVGDSSQSSPVACSPCDVQMRNFLDAVAGNCQPSVTLADGLKAARLALAVLKSAEVNEPVTF